MSFIQELDQSTINQIAAGEVVDRPSSIVKELMENAIDAGATAITVEIKEGGIRYIRITDNGCGIAKEQIPLAFKRHTTSKIRSAEDLLTISSLGFRGEALSSIAAISQVEVITKTKEALTGISYCIEGGEEKSMSEIGAPDGTTFLIQNVFYNTPARLKFLKSPTTEGNYINELVERMALANPSVAIHFINNGQTKLQTTGNGRLQEVIYIVFGRDIAANVIPAQAKGRLIALEGYLGKPVIARGNRTFENYFINGRYIKSSLIAKAIETAYQPYMMQHRYPFVTLHLRMDQEMLDVNVHPAKMEVRFKQEQELFREIVHMLSDLLSGREFIPDIQLEQQAKTPKEKGIAAIPEPFEKKRSQLEQVQELAAMGKEGCVPNFRRDTAKDRYPIASSQGPGVFSGEKEPQKKRVTEYRFDFVSGDASVKEKETISAAEKKGKEIESVLETEDLSEEKETASGKNTVMAENLSIERKAADKTEDAIGESSVYMGMEIGRQENLFEGQQVKETGLLSEAARSKHKLIGQLFDTYWLIQYEDKLFIMDQHAAHEKVLYERTMGSMKAREYTCQQISPPVVISLSAREEEVLQQHKKEFTDLGFEIESFGGREYAIRGVPDNLFGLQEKKLFLDLLDSLSEESSVAKGRSIHEKVASMSCKAAVKGKMELSFAEADALIDELLTLENPYACPHGRPTIISMSRYELEKKFKRIV